MTAIKKPATALPRNLAVRWSDTKAYLESSDGERLATAFDSVAGNQFEAIAHACNEYPKLVEDRAKLVEALRLAADDLLDGDYEIRAGYSSELRALLREIGEGV